MRIFHIGFRVYSQNGNKQDKKGKNFMGWSEKFDDFISSTSPRIAKLDTFARPKDFTNI